MMIERHQPTTLTERQNGSFPRARRRVLLAILLLLGGVESGQAVEDGAAFLAALRDRNMHDVALGYLEARATSPLVDEAFRERIPYEQGMTLIDHAGRTAEPARRTALLEEAQRLLSEFAAANPESDLGGEARLQLAQVLLERGRRDAARAGRMGPGEHAEREKLLEAPRRVIDQARTQFAAAQEYYNNARKQFPTNLDPRTEADKIEKRDEYRRQWLTAWFYKARSLYEKAQAYPADAPEFTQLHEEAVAELADLYEKYHTRLVGLTAHLYEGRGYQALGELDKAIGCYEDLVIQPDGPPEFRLLIAQAYTGLGECRLAQGKFDEAIERGEAWLRSSTRDELTRPDWLAVRFVVAQAKKEKASTLEEGSPPQNRLRREAREEFKLIAREAGPLRREAQQEFAALTNRTGNEQTAAEIKEFGDAFQAARDAFDEMRALAAQAQSEQDPDAAADLEDASEQSRARAQAYFERALVLARSAEDLDLEDLNLARYYLAWLHYQRAEYLRAAILAEFLAQRYPDSRAARDAAKLAMGAYQQLYRSAKEQGARGDELDFEARRLASVADYVIRRWPGTDDAAQAQDMLVSFAVREGRMDEAKEMLEGVDPARRLQSDLRVANGLWAEYLHARQADGEDPTSAETTRLRDEAMTRLEAGFRAAADAGEASLLAATTGLYLAQAHLLADNYEEAISVLQAEKVGPLTLVQSRDTSVSPTEFTIEVMKVAVQAFALASPPQPAKANQAMDALEAAFGPSPDGKLQLAQIYLGLGVQLKQRLEALNSAGQPQNAIRVAAAFEALLERLAELEGPQDWNTRLWMAHTYSEVGKAMAAADPDAPVAQSLLEKSLAAYDALLTAADSQSDLAPSDRAVLAVRKRKADVLRDMGRFSEAMDLYTSLLIKNATMLDVQRDAAYTYQLWGAKDARRFENAIFGGRRVKSTGENLVWGWIKLSRVAAQAARQDSKYRDWYFEGRLNAARSRYLSALAAEGRERTDQLHKALEAIRALYQIHPDLGGPDRQNQFEELLFQIQTALGERPAGLRGFARTAVGQSQ